MVAAVTTLLGQDASPEQRADWARRGDVIAHGGIASALDTQTSLLGGVIRFTGQGLASRVKVAPGFTLVIGNSGLAAATSEVNGRVRDWLSERPKSRLAYFQTVGALSRSAEPLLERGEWVELGKLMNLNQLVLEKIGVSMPQIEGLIESALEAGAFGAKISGSGGGGIIVALASAETKQGVADAITRAGGTALVPDVAVEGVGITEVVKGNAS
jgi:mevalonate kinase